MKSNCENDADKGRLFIVSNRLPISIKPKDDGTFEYQHSSGGLASSLAGLSAHVDFRWFGWPGIDVHQKGREEIRNQLDKTYGAIPVFLNSELAEGHYNGFSNSVLWPLLHSMPEKTCVDSSWPKAYREVNETFADVLVPHLQDGDRIWIHDYHLLLLPSAIRHRLGQQKVKIGFFLHTPFPKEDYFSILPFREAICEAMFDCDAVGFHTVENVNNFLDSAQQVLPGVCRSPHDLHYKGRKVVVSHFPIGISPDKFHKELQNPDTQEELLFTRNYYKDKKILVSVDRLDYTKGIPQKLLAFDQFLTEHPEWRGKVSLIQLAVPSREGVPEYNKVRREVERLVGRVNGKHSTITYVPVTFLHRSLPFDKLCALYASADGCIVSPVRDGFNLVAYEYIVCQSHKLRSAKDGESPGILLLSQYTGAAEMLGSALKFNPWDTSRFAETICGALDMSAAERSRRHERSAQVVDHWTSLHWSRSFLKTLETLEIEKE